MVYGIGIDIIKVERMKSAVEKWGRRFLLRVFTPNEIDYAYAQKEPYRSLSVRFAAKEAVIKALGPHIPVSLTDIEVMNNPDGRPYIKVKGGAEVVFEKNRVKTAHLSLSHEREYGVASVIIET